MVLFLLFLTARGPAAWASRRRAPAVESPDSRGFMPTYEYECSSCGNAFEAFQSITADPIRKCPKCGKKVQRLIGSGGAILFRGSGFYATDYRSKEYRDRAEKDNARKDKTGASSSKNGTGDSDKSKKKKDA